MKTSLNFKKILGLSFLLSTQIAQAMPVSVVAYYETEKTILWQVEQSSGGVDMIVAYLCPKDTPIEHVSQCKDGKKLLRVSEFRKHLKGFAMRWAKRNPDVGMDPLSAEELKLLTDTTNDVERAKKLATLKDELKALEDIMSKFPASDVYEGIKAKKVAEIKTLESNMTQTKPLDETVNGLADSIVKFIATNKEDGKYNSYLRSKMQTKLIHESLNDLFELYVNQTPLHVLYNAPVGAKCSLKIVPDGKIEFWYEGTKGETISDNDAAIVNTWSYSVSDRVKNQTW